MLRFGRKGKNRNLTTFNIYLIKSTSRIHTYVLLDKHRHLKSQLDEEIMYDLFYTCRSYKKIIDSLHDTWSFCCKNALKRDYRGFKFDYTHCQINFLNVKITSETLVWIFNLVLKEETKCSGTPFTEEEDGVIGDFPYQVPSGDKTLMVQLMAVYYYQI